MTVLVQTVARGLLVPAWSAAAALLVKGYSGSGDGFSAGVVAATGLMLQYVVHGRRVVEHGLGLRRLVAVAVAGLAIAGAVVFVPAALGRPLLAHAPAPGEHVVKLGSLELHTALLFDVGVFVVVVAFIAAVLHSLAALAEGRDP